MEAFYSGGNDPGGGHWPVGVHEVARGGGVPDRGEEWALGRSRVAHQRSEGKHRCAQVGRHGSRNIRCFCLSHTLGGEEAEVQTGQVPTIRQWN